MNVHLREIEESESTYLTTVASVSELKALIRDMQSKGCYLSGAQMNTVPGDWQYRLEDGSAYVEIILTPSK